MSSQSNAKIFVVTLKGEQVTVDLDANDTVEALKAKIQAATGTPIAEQYPVFEGQLLANGRDVSEYHLQKEVTIHLVNPVKGGAEAEEEIVDCNAFWRGIGSACPQQ